jgi:allantoinase
VTATTGDPITDAERVLYSPFPTRPAWQWPDVSSSAGVAFCPVITVEYYENFPPWDGVTATDVYGGVGQGSDLRPQITRIGNRDYGVRVGFYRLAEYFAAQSVAPTLAIDALSAERYSEIVRTAVDGGWEIVCHGIGINRAVSGMMYEEDERTYVAEAKERVEQATGVSVTGWYGAAAGESGQSLQILADAGFRYDMDWPNDEQPYYFDTDPGLLSLPLSIDLDDNAVVLGRGVDPWSYAEMITDTGARLVAESAVTARYLSFALNPFISGQPWRYSALAPAISSLLERPQIWVTQPAKVHAAFSALSSSRSD